MSCWGANGQGQLGNNSTANSNVPVNTGLANVSAITASESFTCALVADGHVLCWGIWKMPFESQAVSASAVPVNVGISGLTAIAAGSDFVCGINGAAQVLCWGMKTVGPLSLSHVSSLAASGSEVCAVAGAAVFCWGPPAGVESAQDVPVAVGVDNALAVSVHGAGGCATTTTGDITCWRSDVSAPIKVEVARATDAASKASSTCALNTAGQLICGGDAAARVCRHTAQCKLMLGLTN